MFARWDDDALPVDIARMSFACLSFMMITNWILCTVRGRRPRMSIGMNSSGLLARSNRSSRSNFGDVPFCACAAATDSCGYVACQVWPEELPFAWNRIFGADQIGA